MTLLVGKVTERMRAAIADTFNISGRASTGAFDKKPKSSTENPNLKTDTSIPVDEAALRRLRNLEVEPSAPQLRKFKADALADFDQWRDLVLLRMGEEQKACALREEPPALSVEAIASAFPTQPPQTPGQTEAVLNYLYPPIETSHTNLPDDARATILHSTLLLLLSLEHYTAYSRTLLVRLSTSISVPLSSLNNSEAKVAHGLLEVVDALNADAEAKARADASKSSRRWKVGIASVAGAVAVGITGGLAAPIVAAGIGGILGGIGLGGTLAAGILGSLAGSGVLVGSLFGAYGAGLTGAMMEKYTQEVEDFAFIPSHEEQGMSNNEKRSKRRLRVTIGISGWLENAPEVVMPWRVLGDGTEVSALRWELEALLELGSALQTIVMTYGISIGKYYFFSPAIFLCNSSFPFS